MYLFNYFKRSKTKEYYTKSGEIHVSVIYSLTNYYGNCNAYPIINMKGSYIDTLYGEKFCDIYNIPRDGAWCKIKDILPVSKAIYDDIHHHYIYTKIL